MKNKYYTPSIEEFFVGFEYEEEDDLEDNVWIKRTLDFNYDWLEIHKDFANDKRVKYLDSSDIESTIHENAKDYHTIFKLRSSHEDELVFQTYWIEENEFLDEEYIYWDIKYNQIKITHKSKTLFCGIIKNKSEFKKVLNMLNIK